MSDSDSYLCWVSLAHSVGRVAFITTTISGMILIYFNLFEVRKVFGTYKYIMIIFTALGILLATMEVIFHPNLHFYNMGFVFFTLSKPLNLEQRSMTIFIAMYTGVYCWTISLLAIQFIYRYLALFSSHLLTYFRGWKSLIWVLYCLFFSAQWTLGVLYLMSIDDITTNYFREEMQTRYNVELTEIPARAFIAYDPETHSVRYWNWLYTFCITSIMAVQYGVMIYCGFMMNYRMEEKIRNFSSELKRHHRQMFKTLVFQITTPTIFLFSPLVLIIYLPFFNIKLSFPAGATVCAFNFYPALDVFIVLYVVTEYRKATKKHWNLIRKSFGLSKKSQSVHSTTRESTLKSVQEG